MKTKIFIGVELLQAEWKKGDECCILQRIMRIAWILFTIITMSKAYGGQCKYLPKAKIDSALKIIEQIKGEIPIVDHYCESCLDANPKPIVIDRVEVSPFQVKGYAGIKINGSSIDLAYTYVGGENLAQMVGCKTQNISKFLL